MINILCFVVRKEVSIFTKILAKTPKGKKRYYASLIENKRITGKAIQTVKANPGKAIAGKISPNKISNFLHDIPAIFANHYNRQNQNDA